MIVCLNKLLGFDITMIRRFLIFQIAVYLFIRVSLNKYFITILLMVNKIEKKCQFVHNFIKIY